MLVRHDSRGVLVIGQPSHAWISGQLARAWGSERFGAVEPYEEVCLAAEQHDVGMAMWDLEPPRHTESGLPMSFLQMAIPDHIDLWTTAPRRMLRQSRYAALLVSLHGTRLYAHRDLGALPGAERSLVLEFLESQRRLQDELLESLRSDPKTAASAADPLVERNSGLIGTWDSLSLALCLGYAPYTVTDVPTAGAAAELQLTETHHPERLRLDPWPLRADSLTVRCEGQRLHRDIQRRRRDARCAFASAVGNARIRDRARLELRESAGTRAVAH